MRPADVELVLPVGPHLDRVRALRIQGEREQHAGQRGEHGRHDAEDAAVDLHDAITGTRLTLKLPAQHAAMALIGKQEKAVIARYGF